MKVNGREYHIACGDGDLGRYVIIPGDPGRCGLIAEHLDNAYQIASNREYTTYTGTLCDVPVSVMSTGIGGPGAAIALEEAVELGAHTFIRVGTCGGISLKACAGDVIIATGAIRQEGTSREYAPIEYPAVSDFAVARALSDAASSLDFNWHAGIVQCKDSFYGQHSPYRMPVEDELLYKWKAWKRLGVLASEMESAAVFTVAAALGVRAGTVLSVIWNQERRSAGIDSDADEYHSTDRAIKTAIEAIKLLIFADK